MISIINERIAIENLEKLGYDYEGMTIDYLFDETVKFEPERVESIIDVLERLAVVKGNSLGCMRIKQDF